MNLKKLSIDEIRIVFDFDGVLTDNNVYVNSSGDEYVRCSRSDGLGFDILKKYSVDAMVLSSESNKVVSIRCKKLQIPCIQAIKDKESQIKNIIRENPDKKILYVGNDLNDLKAMKLCHIKICPKDSAKEIIALSDITLTSRGGEGVVREIAVDLLGLDY
tara:strand:- start:4 stop:483 length:480 start_codon:yes stop_codon:yes gene_type:complete